MELAETVTVWTMGGVIGVALLLLALTFLAD